MTVEEMVRQILEVHDAAVEYHRKTTALEEACEVARKCERQRIKALAEYLSGMGTQIPDHWDADKWAAMLETDWDKMPLEEG